MIGIILLRCLLLKRSPVKSNCPLRILTDSKLSVPVLDTGCDERVGL